MVSRYAAYRGDSDTIPPDVIDRILIGACAAVWLVWLGVSVAAVVALVDLGRGFHKVANNSHTTWVLYTVIIVSALVIAGRDPGVAAGSPDVAGGAGRGGDDRAGSGSGRPPGAAGLRRSPPRTGATAPAAGARDRAAAKWSGTEVDRVWLRGTVLLAGTMGVALIAVAAATYLMAVGHEGPSWVGYGVAGAVTAAMPAVEWLHVRQLRRVIAEQ